MNLRFAKKTRRQGIWRRWLLLAGLCQLLAPAVRADRTITFPGSPWSWQVTASTNDLWLRSYSNTVAQFDFKIGAGGCIAEMRACYLTNQDLLCPDSVNNAFPGRDNVLQWVMWAGATTDGTTDAGTNWIKRWNINQGGGYDGFAPVSSVIVTATAQSGSVEVYSQSDEQFESGYDAIFYSTQTPGTWPDWVSQYVRYDLLDKGVIAITRESLVPTIHRTNSIVPVDSTPGDFRYAYFENWSTFYAATNGYFDGLARSLAADGSPNWWFQYHNNIPIYGGDSLTNTAGYAVVYNLAGYTNGNWPVVGVVFGTNEMVTAGNAGAGGTAVMNFDEFDQVNGLGYISILPACTVNLPVPGSVVSYQTYLVPRSRGSADFIADLNHYAALVPPPTVYAPGYSNVICSNLQSNVPWGSPQNSQRVPNLAPLAGGLMPPPLLSGWGMFPGFFALNGTGPTGQSYRVFSATNIGLGFSDWLQVGSGSFTGGVFQFNDPFASNYPQRYYRLATP